IKEMIFYNYLYFGDLSRAMEYSRYLIKIGSSDKISEFIYAKRIFYLASIYSIQGLFTESNKILINCSALDKDKDGWNIGLRLLSIINNIEVGKLIFVEGQIEN